jgi:uncharacterized protein (TIGR02147 family)
MKSKINTLDYTNYREYLKDYYLEQKKCNKSFSYRYFAKRAGYNSSSLYSDIVEGKRVLNQNQVFKFSKAIKHNKKESEYFENMVCFGQAKETDEKKKYFERMMKLIGPKSSKIDPRHYSYFSKWYYPIVREILSVINFRDDYYELSRSISPRISVEEAKRAISVLKNIGFIKRNKKGYYKPSEPSITTGPDVKALSIKNFQKELMDLAKGALDRYPPQLRDISTVTMSLPSDKVSEIKAGITAFRKKIVKLTSDNKNVDCVYQFNMQLFPFSDIKKK